MLALENDISNPMMQHVCGKSEWKRSEFGVQIIEYTAEYRRIDEYSFVIYNTCSIGACAYRVILDKL